MVDINTHKIIDMLESREQDEVIEWLKSYPSIKVVSRDGSIIYHNSISAALPDATQISDRFHLYKNLTDYAIEYLKKHLKKKVEVIIDSTDIEVPTLNEISKANKNRKLTLEENKVEQGKKKIIMKRNGIFKTLFRSVSNIKNFEENKFLCFCEQYPFFNVILELVNLFEDIFIKNKPELLNEWIAKARSTEIEELISFTNGIERDYEAVVNAVCLPYSNGLAEGSVNKIKVVKRVMYGRCSFETLRSKTIRLEKIRKIN